MDKKGQCRPALLGIHRREGLQTKKLSCNGKLFTVENIGIEPITSSLPAKRSSQVS
jgi:hypothetical protein